MRNRDCHTREGGMVDDTGKRSLMKERKHRGVVEDTAHRGAVGDKGAWGVERDIVG